MPKNEPMNMEEFAKKFYLDVEEFFDLPFDECYRVVKDHGYIITGIGIVPSGEEPEIYTN